MKISFQKMNGEPSVGTAFFWKLQIDGAAPTTIDDTFIPELFYDFFFLQQGKMRYVDGVDGTESWLPQQALKTLFTHGVTFQLALPITLFGVRLTLPFAESFWRNGLPSNCFLPERWIEHPVNDIADFATQIRTTLQNNQVRKTAVPLLSPTLQESDQLAHFSARHKRRLYKSIFGLSKKEMLAIQNIHAFLGQSCDFSSQNPRIIEHINSELFYDQPHLNHAFKKITGLSPLEHFQANSILQDNLMAASYNEILDAEGIVST